MNLTFLKNLPGMATGASFASLFLAVCLSAAPAHGPKLNPVQWNLSAAPGPVSPGSTIVLHLHADIAPGYHLYSLTTPAGGPIRTTLSINDSAGLDNVRVYQPAPNRHNDPNLNVPVETFSGPTDFPIAANIKKNAALGTTSLVAQTRYQACSDEICLPPVNRSVTAVIDIQKGVPVTEASVSGSYHLVSNPLPTAAKPNAASGSGMSFDFRFLPLLWGGKLGELESFLSAADSQTSIVNNVSGKTASPVWRKNDYGQALAQAQREHKPLLVSFSWMNANILPRPEISAALQNFVLVGLYTDGTDAASSKNQMLEQDRFSTVALPYYAILDGNEEEVAHHAGLTRDAQQFLSFLRSGLNSVPDVQTQTATL